MDGERAGVDVAHRVDQAHHPPGAAHAEAGQRTAVGAEVEEGVAGEHLLAAGHQPVVELALLSRGGMQIMPHVRAPAGWAQPGEPQLGAVAIGDRLELVELADVVPGHHDRDLEAAEPRIGEVAYRPQRGRVRAGPADRVVDLGRRPVERDLHVDVVAGGEPAGDGGSDLHPVGGELDPDVMAGGVADQVPEVGPHGRLTAADVHVEHLHALHLVDQCPALRGGQLPRVAAPGTGQAVHARQVARVGQLPGQADRRGQAVLELLDQGERGSSSGHGGVLQRCHWGRTRRMLTSPCDTIKALAVRRVSAMVRADPRAAAAGSRRGRPSAPPRRGGPLGALRRGGPRARAAGSWNSSRCGCSPSRASTRRPSSRSRPRPG